MSATTRLVSRTQTIAVNNTIFIGNTSAPKWVFFSGTLPAYLEVAAPSGPCTAASPGQLPAGALVVAAGVDGVGLTSGLKYEVGGNAGFKDTVQVPGTAAVAFARLHKPGVKITAKGGAMKESV